MIKIKRSVTLIVIGMSSVIIMMSVIIFSTAKTPQGNSMVNVTTKDIVKAFSSDAVLSTIFSKGYNKLNLSYDSMNLKLPTKDYGIIYRSSDVVGYEARSDKKSEDTSDIRNGIDDLMKFYGFSYTKSSTELSSKTNLYSLYTNDNMYCQFSSYSQTHLYKFSCANASDITSEYVATDNLISLLKKQQAVPHFLISQRYSKLKSQVSYSILSLADYNRTSFYLFGAVDDDWEYLGDISGDTTKLGKAEYQFNSAIKAKIDDPKYEGFLSSELY